MKSKNLKGGYSMSEELNKSEPAIIIPAYCPDARLLKLIIEIHKIKNLPIVVIDDGSGGEYKKIFLAVEEVPNCIVYYHKVLDMSLK